MTQTEAAAIPVRPGPPIGPAVQPCAAIEKKIAQVTEDLNQAEADIKDAPPKYKPVFQHVIDRDKAELASLRNQLAQCEVANLPDLVPIGYTTQFDHARQVVGVSIIVANNGGGDCTQPFTVAVGITTPAAEYQENFEESFFLQPGDRITTGYMNVGLAYNVDYILDVLVDADYTVQEANKFNNTLHQVLRFRTP